MRMRSEAMGGVKVNYDKPVSQSDISSIMSYLHGKNSGEEETQEKSAETAGKKIMFKRLMSNVSDCNFIK